MRLSRCVIVSALALAPVTAHAQKKALTQADWDKWKSIQGAAISNDGKWALYSIVPQVGDGELVLRATAGSTEYHVPRGYLGRPNNVPGGLRPRATGNPEDDPTGATAAPGQFTADSKYAVVLTYPMQAEFERAARNRRAAAALQTRSDLAIVNVADGKVTAIPRVRSFRVSANNGTWLAYVPEDSAAASDSAARGGRGGAPIDSSARGPRRQYGTALVIRNLSTGAEERLTDVQTYAFDDSAKVLGYTVISRQPGKDGAYVRNMTTGVTTTLLTGTGDYKGLTFDRSANQLAFFSNKDEFGKPKAGYTLYTASLKNGGAAAAGVMSASVPKGMRVADNSALTFTKSGNAVSFGVAPILADSVPTDSLTGKAVFDLWHYKDAQLQPTQRINAARDRGRSYTSLYYPATKRIVALAVDSLPTVQLGDDGKVVLGTTRERYNVESMWGDGGTDVYVIDGTTGVAKVVKEKISGQATLSPDDKYIAYFDDARWFTYNTSTGKTIDVTGAMKAVHFDQETHDSPSIAPSWGIAGWTKGDKSMLVYDRFDLWEIDPTGTKPAVMVTDSVGRKNNITLRLMRIGAGGGGGGGGRGGGGGGGFGGGAGNDTANVYDGNGQLFFRAMNEETKAAGFYRDQLGAHKAPEPVVMADVSWGTPLKAKNAEQYLVTKGTFVDFPNLYTGASLTSLAKISDANPQQKDFNWGTVELVKWISSDGFEQKGLLYKPENFDPGKKYPMVSYFYEQLSNGMHNYVPPNGRNVINPTHYVSNGYLVFEPDIHYEVGYPGPSAMKSIVPGVQMLMQRGYVDPKKLGLQGQSWGGYQTLYMITQTQMFAAAMAGAPVVNMTSAYGGIRWGTGVARAFQYEKTQSRIGGSIWEYPTRYIENSPLFWLDKVTTPLFIMNNDADDAVPWYQGIETFVGMRRLGKEVYFIDYNNDVHNPASRANQKDIAMRMQQFFDTKLKGAPAPDWMVHGIPYRDKGRDQLSALQP
ncbi:MAG: prolyl oligopeptidase family serine peptidase [Gemmatimonadaceae bacterium]